MGRAAACRQAVADITLAAGRHGDERQPYPGDPYGALHSAAPALGMSKGSFSFSQGSDENEAVNRPSFPSFPRERERRTRTSAALRKAEGGS
jgi:hypothetical protein